MIFSLMTYNTYFNQAVDKLTELLKTHRPDILCLQEIETTEKNLQTITALGYTLADYSNSFIKFGKIYGLATYYNINHLKFIDSNTFHLKKSIYEFLLTVFRMFSGGNESRTMLESKFIHRITKKSISVLNLHLSMLGTNSIRSKQINQLLIKSLKRCNHAVIITGDFNYPYGRKKLENIMNKYHLKEASHNIFYTFQRLCNNKGFDILNIIALKLGIIKLKLDYVFYKNIKCLGSEKIDVGFSDHFPIISRFKFIE